MATSSTRRKVKVKARQLDEVDVEFLSLVDHAATRIPFRLLKSEKSKMSINLSNLFFRKAEPEVLPAIIGVLVTKTADIPAVQKTLSGLGYEFPVLDESHENAIVLKAEGTEFDEDTAIVKVTEDLALAVSNVQKGLRAWADSNSFVENVQKAGFFPGLRVATEVLMDTIGNIAMEEGDQEATVSQMEKSLEDYKGYVMKMVDAIPSDVFKMEGIVVPVAERVLAENVVEKAAGTVSPLMDDSVAEAENKDEAPVVKDENDDSKEASALETQMAALASTVQELGTKLDAIAGMGTDMADLKKTAEELATKVSDVEKSATAATEAIKGTVDAGTTGDPTTPEPKKVMKEDDPGFWDSALSFKGFETA